LLDQTINPKTFNPLAKNQKLEGDKMEMVKKFFKDECGATMIEYGLMVALVAIATIVAVGYLQQGLNTTFNNAADKMNG
jgi:pilus assembly protein Flp/PilA